MWLAAIIYFFILCCDGKTFLFTLCLHSSHSWVSTGSSWWSSYNTSEHVQDVQSCLNDESNCKTLTYVLCQLETVNSKATPSKASVTVKVTYNQTISEPNKYNFDQEYDYNWVQEIVYQLSSVWTNNAQIIHWRLKLDMDRIRVCLV